MQVIMFYIIWFSGSTLDKRPAPGQEGSPSSKRPRQSESDHF